MTILILLKLIPWAIAVTMLLWGTWYTFRKIRRSRLPCDLLAAGFSRGKVNHAICRRLAQGTRSAQLGPGVVKLLPPVSILKPLKGAEPGIESNLSGFFLLDYPCYEILFCVANDKDPAASVVRELMKKYPTVSARLMIGEVDIGPNPKVNNLYNAYHEASYDLLLISDSNVRVSPGYLRSVVSYLDPDVGVVTAVVAGTRAKGWGGHLEAAYLNSFYARWMNIADSLGMPFVVGKSMLFKRSTAERFGGIENLGQYIAEDYMAGQAMRRLGLKVVIMAEPICQYIGDHAFRAFWTRHLRWGRIRKAQAPLAFFVEPFQFSLISGCLGAWAFQTWMGIPFFYFFTAHLFLWAVFDLLLIRKMNDKLNMHTIFFWFLRECLAFPLWCHMACGSSINWRGHRLKILPGGLVVPTR